MFTASKKIDYGIMLMASLPEHGEQHFRSLQDVADERKLSAGFLGQVMMPLRKAGLVESREGVHGGYQLSRSSDSIRISDIYEALEGPLALTTCQDETKSSACEKTCPTKDLWGDLQGLMKDYLEKKTIADFRNPKASA